MAGSKGVCWARTDLRGGRSCAAGWWWRGQRDLNGHVGLTRSGRFVGGCFVCGHGISSRRRTTNALYGVGNRCEHAELDDLARRCCMRRRKFAVWWCEEGRASADKHSAEFSDQAHIYQGVRYRRASAVICKGRIESDR